MEHAFPRAEEPSAGIQAVGLCFSFFVAFLAMVEEQAQAIGVKINAVGGSRKACLLAKRSPPRQLNMVSVLSVHNAFLTFIEGR